MRFFQKYGETCMTAKERIKELCKEKGISINKLENELGFGAGYISKLDKSTPNSKKIKQIADYFDTSIDYIINGHVIEIQKTGQNHAEVLKMYSMLSKEEQEQIKNMMEFFIKNRK